jgi:aminopeptidase N
MSRSSIRLLPDLCDDMIAAIEGADWDAAERGDLGTQESWDADGEAYAEAQSAAAEAVDAEAGIVDGAALACALEQMRRLEVAWGDDPQTQIVRRAVARILDGDVDGRDLIEMLRGGEG